MIEYVYFLPIKLAVKAFPKTYLPHQTALTKGYALHNLTGIEPATTHVIGEFIAVKAFAKTYFTALYQLSYKSCPAYFLCLKSSYRYLPKQSFKKSCESDRMSSIKHTKGKNHVRISGTNQILCQKQRLCKGLFRIWLQNPRRLLPQERSYL